MASFLFVRECLFFQLLALQRYLGSETPFWLSKTCLLKIVFVVLFCLKSYQFLLWVLGIINLRIKSLLAWNLPTQTNFVMVRLLKFQINATFASILATFRGPTVFWNCGLKNSFSRTPFQTSYLFVMLELPCPQIYAMTSYKTKQALLQPLNLSSPPPPSCWLLWVFH